MSTDTMQRRLDNVIGSIESRTWLVGQYISESAKDPQAHHPQHPALPRVPQPAG